VKQELDKTMEQVRCPSAALGLWQATGALATLIPALANVSKRALTIPDYLAVPGPTKRPARRVIRFAGLLLEVGSPAAGEVMTGLRSSRNEIHSVTTLIDRWQAQGASMTSALFSDRPIMDAQVRRWVAGIGRLHVAPFMRLASAVWHAARGQNTTAPSPEAVRSLYRRMLRSAFLDAIDLGALAIDGDDLRRAGIPAGPGLGKILQGLLAAVLDDPGRNTTDWLLQEARRLQSQQQ
jgi:hypothetical protein